MLEQADEMVEILAVETGGRGHNRSAGLDNVLEQRMVRGGTTGDLYHFNIEPIDPLNGRFVEWRGHRDHTGMTDFVGEKTKVRLV